MHTILGANGVIAKELSRSLAGHLPHIRQVSPNPQKVNPTDETLVLVFKIFLFSPRRALVSKACPELRRRVEPRASFV